ncbi:Uncharacterized protein AC511_1127 [Pseudomonas coronafaciens pv. oryzae]|nr:Uncharacterized protein AC511_1127 [Pseudomonas coronafaciens pv. oryzae]
MPSNTMTVKREAPSTEHKDGNRPNTCHLILQRSMTPFK